MINSNNDYRYPLTGDEQYTCLSLSLNERFTDVIEAKADWVVRRGEYIHNKGHWLRPYDILMACVESDTDSFHPYRMDVVIHGMKYKRLLTPDSEWGINTLKKGVPIRCRDGTFYIRIAQNEYFIVKQYQAN